MAGLQAATYCVSPDGHPANPGTRERPWNVERANEALGPGDAAIFLKGDYTQPTACVEPASNGRDVAPIVYRSENAGAAVLRPDKYAIRLESRQHIVIDGFHIVPTEGSGFGYVRDSTDCTIENCHMEAPASRRSTSRGRSTRASASGSTSLPSCPGADAQNTFSLPVSFPSMIS